MAASAKAAGVTNDTCPAAALQCAPRKTHDVDCATYQNGSLLDGACSGLYLFLILFLTIAAPLSCDGSDATVLICDMAPTTLDAGLASPCPPGLGISKFMHPKGAKGNPCTTSSFHFSKAIL